jgi:hypothetical protein
MRWYTPYQLPKIKRIVRVGTDFYLVTKTRNGEPYGPMIWPKDKLIEYSSGANLYSEDYREAEELTVEERRNLIPMLWTFKWVD